MGLQPFAQRWEEISARELVGIGFEVQRVPQRRDVCGFQSICGEQRSEFIKSQVVKMRGHGMESGLDGEDAVGMVMDDLHGTSELPAAEALIGCRFPPACESAITLQGDGET